MTPIAPLTAMPLLQPQQPAQQQAAAPEGFGETMKSFLQQANASQINADNAIKGVVTGKSQDIHQVMLAMEQARLSMLAIVEARNKVVEAYQEIVRMPV